MNNMKIKFISYDGEWPCLCYGQLKMKIGRKTYTFGKSFNSPISKLNLQDSVYPKFWMSGGKVTADEDWNFDVQKDEWISTIDEFNKKDFPVEVVDNIDEIMRVFNENVPYGCCGGCI